MSLCLIPRLHLTNHEIQLELGLLLEDGEEEGVPLHDLLPAGVYELLGEVGQLPGVVVLV